MEIEVEINERLIEERDQLQRDLAYEKQKNEAIVKQLEAIKRLLKKREDYIHEILNGLTDNDIHIDMEVQNASDL